MVSSDSLDSLSDSIIDAYLGLLKLAGIMSFAFAVVNLVTFVFLALFIPGNALPKSLDVRILSEVARSGLPSLVLFIIIGPVFYYIVSVLIHPSRLGPVVTQLESTPDSEGYRGSPMAFFTVHVLKPLMGLSLILISLVTFYLSV